jgi:hypothetical protein
MCTLADTNVSEEFAASVFRVEILLCVYQITWCRIKDNCNLHVHYCCKLKLHKKLLQLFFAFCKINDCVQCQGSSFYSNVVEDSGPLECDITSIVMWFPKF